ncbi:MAG: glutamate 5-kinase [Candidatus Nanopelagicales bacterium]|nr:glutamate 5-kinase [Candidatus Nanopelagicales bacterium]
MTTEVRSAIAEAMRIVVKVGSSSLTLRGGGIDDEAISALVAQLAARRARGHQVVLVSSGSIATGFPVLGLTQRPRDLATQQASASVGQGMLIARYTSAFAEHGLTVGQVLLTADDVTRRAHYRNAQRTLFRLLELGVVPIVNENDTVATNEIRVGDNDRLAALVAHVVQAQALILLSDVDGLYDGPPSKGGATLITSVASDDDLRDLTIGGTGEAGVGLGGMSSKVEAARIASSAGIPVLLTSASRAAQALATADVGTAFAPTGSRTSTRLLWLKHATTGNGRLHLDAGAALAITRRGSSLLPAGITSVEGIFAAGDPVDLVDDTGRAVARGLVNFDSPELPGLLGRSTKELAKELGPAYEREVVHRDDLVLLRGSASAR